MSCVIRDSREDDLVHVHSIYSHHVLHGTASFEEKPPSLEELTRRRADVLGGGDGTLPAGTARQEEAGKTIGGAGPRG